METIISSLAVSQPGKPASGEGINTCYAPIARHCIVAAFAMLMVDRLYAVTLRVHVPK